MKILIINSEYPPVGAGAGNASLHIARELVGAGHQVVVVTAGQGNLPVDEVAAGVRILRGPAKRRRIDRSTALEQVVFMMGATIRCLALLREYRPDVVLAFFGLPSGGVAWVLRALTGTPYVVSLRGGDVPGFRPYDFWLYHRIAVPFLRIIWRGAGAVVANSSGLRELGQAFDRQAEILIIPNGVNPDDFWQPDRTWSQVRILSVGRIVYQKGLDLAVRALAGLRDISWEWRVAGDGPQADSLRAQVRHEGLEDRVQLLGWLTPDALVREYQAASLFVFPSRHEGMPNAVLEAMASGLAVVATRIAGNEELVSDGDTGKLVPSDNVERLQDALREMLGDEGMRRRMGLAARKRAVELYGWTATTNQYLRILEKVQQ